MSLSNHTVHLSPPGGYSGPRRCLVLAGGGMRVAYQAGVIQALADAGLCFFHGDGTSGGTINLGMLFSGLSPAEICDRWRTVDVKDFVSLMPLKNYLKASDMMAMGDADGIVQKVFPHLGIDVARINAAAGMTGTFNVCNYTRKTNEAVPHDKVELAHLVAAISLPVFMPAVPHRGQLYVDSVWIKDANLSEAVRRGSDEIWLVWCIGNTGEYRTGLFNQYVHMIELSANGVLFEEFDRINELNDRIHRGESVSGRAGPIRLHVIKPQFPLPLDPDFYFGRIDAATLIALGYRDAHKYLAARTPDGVPFKPEATSMTDPQPGISFRETMAGPFAWGATDPREGARQGEERNTSLTMTATILIRDLTAFISDANHAGELVGSVHWPPFGGDIPARTGVFNLFSPASDPTLKLMVYELGFEHGGENYYLAGKKEVRDNPGFDLWTDTTTLLTRLHKGKDASGPVVAAGILRLGVAELTRLVRSMTAPGTHSVAERTRTIATFGRFFMGELWERYAGMVQES